jgi:hypothetical protein
VTVMELPEDAAASVGSPYTSCTQDGVICFEHARSTARLAWRRELPFGALKTDLV